MKTVKIALVIITLFIFVKAESQTYIWDNPNGGSFADITNWNPNGTPSSSLDTLIFNTGTNLTITEVPTAFLFAAVIIEPNVTDPTNVIFSFGSNSAIDLNELNIGSNCSLYFEDVASMDILGSCTLNQAILNIAGTVITFETGCTTNISGTTSIIASNIVNNGNFYLNSSTLSLESLFDNLGGTFNFMNGTLNVGTGINFNGLYYGSTYCSLIINSSVLTASSVQALPSIILGTLKNQTGFSLSMNGDLTIENMLDLGTQDLIMSSNTLILNGDFKSGGGKLNTSLSSLTIGTGSNTVSTMKLMFSDAGHSLDSLSLNRSGSIIDIESNLVVNTLNLMNGKLRFANHNLTLNNLSAAVHNKSSYVITGLGGNIISYILSNNTNKIPVGSEKFYAPVRINPSSTNTYVVNVLDKVYSGGRTGVILQPDELVDLTWRISSPNDLPVSYVLDLNWDIAAQGSGFDLAKAYIAYHNDIEWIKLANIETAATDIDINYQRITSTSDYGLFAVSSQENLAPVANTLSFTIPEHSPDSTVVGKLDITDPNIDQIVKIFVHEHPYADAFRLEPYGTILVANSYLLEYSINPVFTYTIDACDNGFPVSCSQFDVIINLEEVDQDFFISNYISPNNDGQNDFWIVQGAERIDYDVVIFNNSGSIVFKTDNYMNNWDGTSNGKKLAPGVYYYLIRTPNGQRKGTITLVR